MTKPVLIVLQLALAIGVPALIALLAPRRWRGWAVLLWALAPLLIVAGVAASELASGKSSPADIDKLIHGVLIIGGFALPPWLMACGVGYGIGALLRGRGRARADAAPAPPAPALSKRLAEVVKPVAEAPPIGVPITFEPPIDDGVPTLSPSSGWEAAHVGFDHDDLVLDGLPIWSLTWRETGEKVVLAHPAHRAQQHDFDVYDIDDGARATRFAAAELSNGVWGFYRWVVPADPASGVSADGSLRYEHDLGPYEGGRYDATALSARLYDKGSETPLFDGAAWQSSRVIAQADGSLLLSLEQGELQTIFHIDPPAGEFRDLGAGGPTRPLDELAQAAAAARGASDDPANTYLGRRIAPDGSLIVELQAMEWSNTHWVRSPRVTEIATGRVLLDLWGTDWDAWPSFPRRGAVRLSFRRYHFGGAAEVEIELAPERYILFEGAGAGATTGPLGDLPEALEQASRRSAAQAPPRPVITPARTTLRSGLVVLLILLGAFALIAVATLITLKLEGEPPSQKLDVIPPMPPRP